MFRKQIKVKAHNQLRSSEQKQLVDSFLKCYPNFKSENVKGIFPKKESISLLKIETSSNTLVDVYLVQKRAVAFKIGAIIFPTVYTLWNYPDLLISFTTNSLVLSKVKEGADLMIPGVFFPKVNQFSLIYGTFEKGTPGCINLEKNRAPVAVGVTAQNSGDIFLSTKGKCLIIYHTIGDKLCTLENLPMLPIPELQPPEWILNEENVTTDYEELEEKLQNVNIVMDEDCGEQSGGKNINENLPVADNTTNKDENEMDKLLKHCFLSCVKFSKNVQLPILTSTFYKNYVVPYCPENLTIDIKKSSFKKLSTFLKEMSQLGIILVQEKKPGVDEIVEISRMHPILQKFRGGNKLEQEQVIENKPVIEESLTITAAVLPIFSEFNLKKGSVVQKSQVRNYITEYVKSLKLQNENDPKMINVNQPLSLLFQNKSCVTWEELFQKLFTSMGSCFKIQNNETEIVQKGKLEPIILSISTRTGNKKVTLIDNLETFGINIENFAKECQQGVAASTSINAIKGKKSRQLLVQGNQINFIVSQLQSKYKIPKQYISGTENAIKKKNTE